MRVLAAIFLTISVLAAPAAATELERVVDGDTIVISEGKVRMVGIDAFESEQSCLYEGARYPCGEMATRMLERLLSEGALACRSGDGGNWRKGRYDRWLLVCQAGGIDVNASMVASGWALVDARYDRRYADHQARAKRERRGAWQGRFVEPWKWRKGERLP